MKKAKPKTKKKFELSASLICGRHLSYEKDIHDLEKAGIDSIHFDVMDGVFVPRFGLYPEQLVVVKEMTKISVTVHLMIEEPEKYVKQFVDAGGDIVVVHAEATRHLDRAIRIIRESGGRAGVALNPGTPLSALDHVLDDIDMVMLMAINPGIVGHKIIPTIFNKIAALKKILRKYPDVIVEIDGGVTPDTAAHMVVSGATSLVCGTSSIYKKDIPLTEKVPEFRNHVQKQLKKV